MVSVGRTIHVSFDFGGGKQTMEKTSAYPLNDGRWHTVLIERNVKQTTLRVDLQAPVAMEEIIHHPSQTNDGHSPLVVGDIISSAYQQKPGSFLRLLSRKYLDKGYSRAVRA